MLLILVRSLFCLLKSNKGFFHFPRYCFKASCFLSTNYEYTTWLKQELFRGLLIHNQIENWNNKNVKYFKEEKKIQKLWIQFMFFCRSTEKIKNGKSTKKNLLLNGEKYQMFQIMIFFLFVTKKLFNYFSVKIFFFLFNIISF